MPRLAPLPREATAGLNEILRASEGRMGFVPNSQLIMARRPEILRAFAQLGQAINGPSSTIDSQLRNMVSQMASRAAGCGYCMAHTAHTAERVGVPTEKENALWEYETSPLFSPAERAALRVAQGAAQVPNAVTDTDFAELKNHYSEAQIVDIVAVIATTRWRPSWKPRRSKPASVTSPNAAGLSASTPREQRRGRHAAESASSTGHPGASPASQRSTASASTRSIALRSAIFPRISAR